MNYNNYSLSASKGKLYLKSKTPQEGYEEITYGTKGDKTYHKYFSSIKGVPTSFESKEIQHEGKTLKFLELTLVDGEEANKISVPLKNKGGYTDETKSLLSALNGLELGEEVTLTPTVKESTGSNGKTYKNLNIYINYVNRLGENGKGLSTGFINYTDIPSPIKEEVAGDIVWNWTPQTEFYWEKLKSIEERFKQEKSTPNHPPRIPTATPQQAFEPATNVSRKYDDNLPF